VTIPHFLGMPVIYWAVLGVLMTLAVAMFVILKLLDWNDERKRRQPVVYIAPRMRVIAVPAVTRRKYPEVWS
jgi:hypothetical protein